MRLNFIRATSPKTSAWVYAHQPLHEVTSLIGELHPVLVPLYVSRKNILENLLWRLRMERRNAV
jgi:hypothetical protein